MKHKQINNIMLFMVIISLILLVISLRPKKNLNIADPSSSIVKYENMKDLIRVLNKDAYRMFYGEWKIVEVRSYEEVYNSENEKEYKLTTYILDDKSGKKLKGDLCQKPQIIYTPMKVKNRKDQLIAKTLGSRMTYNYDIVKWNDLCMTKSPVYRISIQSDLSVLGDLAGSNDGVWEQWKELRSDINKQPYYVYASINLNSPGYDLIDGSCSCFVMIDDNTMIGNNGSVSVKLKRIKYIDDVKKYYTYQKKDNAYGDAQVSHLQNECGDNTYKIFYGKWQVKRVIIGSESDSKSRKEIDKILGGTIEFTKNKIAINEEVIDNPMYNIQILPVKPKTQNYMGISPTLDELGITGSIFSFVEVIPSQKNYHILVNKFFIKDDNTLIAKMGDNYLELSRKEHIPDVNYEMEIDG